MPSAPTDKLCARCGESKQAAAFYASQRSADGLASECRECSAERQRQRRARVRNMEPVVFDPRRLFWSVPEVVSICGVRSERWVYRRLDAGVFDAPERGQGVTLRVTGKSLQAYLESTGAL